MTVFYDALQDIYLGYAAIFACVSLGLFFLRQVDKGEVGPGLWSMGFLLNALGFVFWSGAVPIRPTLYFLAGEALHVAGFLALVWGICRFAGYGFKRWNVFAVLAWTLIWAGALVLFPRNALLAGIILKGVRTLLFVFAGTLVLTGKQITVPVGRHMAGWSLIAWGLYMSALSVLSIVEMKNLAFGFLVGLQLLSALGLVVMSVDRIRTRAEESEKLAKRLEGLLPICSHCKKIRDDKNEWHVLESYIKDHSTAEFSHGICPECLEKYYPKVAADKK